MGKIKGLIIIVLIVAAFGAGIYFSAPGGPASGWRDSLTSYFNCLGKQTQVFEKSQVGQVITQASKQLLTPPPLLAKNTVNSATLLQSKIIEQTNLQRQENGNLPALKENEQLDQAAGAKANDLFSKQYFDHVSPTGVDPGKLVQSFGYDYIVAGENLILGSFSSEKEVVDDWMASPGHRANILNNRYTEIGVAIVKGTYKGESVWIGVQEFGLPMSTCAQPSETLKTQINSEKTQLDALTGQLDENKKQLDATDSSSAVYSQMVDDYNKMVEDYNSLASATKTAVAN